uniref:Uncharacterized protein n=1 Tax=Zea mays TaxID=4577 RepID=C4J6S6_MAIZE|nr:unknown [Zea mays]
MVPCERVERAKLDPAAAELLGCVAAEAADVSADHGDAEEAEAEHGVDGVAEVVPRGGVVSGPVRGVPAGPHERGPAEHEGPAAGVGEQRAVRGSRLQEAVEVVCVVVAHAAVVHRGRRRGLVVDGAVHAGVVDAVRRVVQRVEGRRVDEVGDLVHVDPEAVDGERPPEQGDLARPELGGARVEEVREVDVPGPHLAEVVGAVPLQEHVLLHPSHVRPVCLVHADPWVYNDDVFLAVPVEAVDELPHRAGREVHRIQREVLERVHVVDVRPHHL